MKKTTNTLLFFFFALQTVFSQENTNETVKFSSENQLLFQFKNSNARVAFFKSNDFETKNALFSVEKIIADWEIYLIKINEDVFKINQTTSNKQTNFEENSKFAKLKIDSLEIVLKNNPQIANIQRNTAVKQRGVTPNDTYFRAQNNLKLISAEDAWTFGTGGVTALGDTIVVAVIDGGMDFACDDFAGNIWYNKHEIPQNGIDDDNNGYIDDYKGWNFDTEDDDVDTPNSHGTAMAGVIGGKGNNNKGIAGINWNIKLLTIRGAGTQAQIVGAYKYVYDLRKKYDATNGREGAFIVATNASWGIDRVRPSDFPLWAAMYDTLGKVGILTAGAAADVNCDVDIVGDMPTNSTSNFLIGVTATNLQDKRLSFVAYGKKSVDITSPEDIFNVLRDDVYGAGVGGTSGATSHVTGAIALLHSYPNTDFALQYKKFPAQTAVTLRNSILESVDKRENLKAEVSSGGRLNLYKSFAYLNDLYAKKGNNFSVIYPNPANNYAILEVTNRKGSEFKALVFDNLGRKITENTLEIVPYTTIRFVFDTSLWANGMYYIVLSIDNQEQPTRKLMVMH